MVVAGPEGFRKNQYRKFNIRSTELAAGDDYGMMREVLTRRFKRLLSESPRVSVDDAMVAVTTGDISHDDESPSDVTSDVTWPDLVLIDGGQGQLRVAQETLAALGVNDVPLIAIAKGLDRDAGRESFHMAGKAPFRLPPRDPVLYFVERLRDEAHRFAIGSHSARRKKDIREAGLQEIPGIGPTRKRALLRHFGTLKAIERASLPDLSKVPGINAETARKIYDFFHEKAS
jgi:excinuclease ABC subunit C